MLICDLVGEGPTRAGIASLRADIEELRASLDAAESSAASLPHRAQYLQLTIAFLRGLLQLHLDWIDDVERELDRR